MEDKETDAPNYLRTLERKKVLSNIESLGLLSAAEKAGLSLSKVGCLKVTLPHSNTSKGGAPLAWPSIRGSHAAETSAAAWIYFADCVQGATFPASGSFRCECVQMEELKLFSTAERLGLLSTLERLLVSDPAAVSSLSLVPFIGTVGEPMQTSALLCAPD